MNPTRYLCAAVQLDEFLCEKIINEFLEDSYTVIGICHGIDIPTVLRSCLLADKIRKERDLTLFILFIASSLFIHFKIYIGFCIIFCIAWIVMFLYRKTVKYKIVGENLLKENFNLEFLNKFKITSKMQAKLENIAKTQDANVIIYGGKLPFVGSGLPIGGWSLSIDISKEKQRNNHHNTSKFQISDLFKYVSQSIRELNLHKSQIKDYLYVSGGEIRDEKKFLTTPFMRPNTKLESIDFQKYIENDHSSARHYKCVQVVDWGGELIISVFFRFSMIGQNLFIEVNYYLLTPLSPHYYELDRMKSKASFTDICQIAFETLFTMILWSIVSPISIFGRFIRYFPFLNSSKFKHQRKEIKSNMAYNYGALTSLRERLSHNNEYTSYFQHLDQEMYVKAIERRIIDSLLEFLESKNIDISDFKDVKSTIINHGIMLSDQAYINSKEKVIGKKEVTSIFNNNAK
jgi:hypothetical protein